MNNNICVTPGLKLRSKGMGRGLARGGGRGPRGVPFYAKLDKSACTTPGLKLRSGGMGRGLARGGGFGPIGAGFNNAMRKPRFGRFSNVGF